MAIYPLISGPCPYKGPLSEIMDGDICCLCHKKVHDLTDMTDEQRRAFIMSACSSTCVSYRVSSRTAVMIAALTASALGALPAAAQPPAQSARAQSDRDDDVVVVITSGRMASNALLEIAMPVEAITFDAEPEKLQAAFKPTSGPEAKPANGAEAQLKPTHD